MQLDSFLKHIKEHDMLSIVIPTYNRAYMLEKVYLSIKKVMESEDIPFEMVFVNDCSQDNTREVLSLLCSLNSNVKGITLEKNYGQQNATLAGIRYCKYSLIVTSDDDMSYNPQSIIALFKEISKGYDIVYGVARNSFAKKYRKVGTKFKELLFLIVLKKPLNMRLTSFRIMNKKVVDHVKADQNSKVYISASALQIKPKIQNIPIDELTKGEPSNYTLLKLARVLIGVILNYSFISKAYHLFDKKEQYIIKEFHS